MFVASLLLLLVALPACSGDPPSDPTDTADSADAAPDARTLDAVNCYRECPAAGDTRCEGDTVETCADRDGDGCREWGDPTACTDSESCEDGACVPACEDACDSESATRCADTAGRVERCADADDDPCLEWTEGATCADREICEDGVCVTDCEDACDTEGATRCTDAGSETCGDHDDDACFEWSDPTTCTDNEACREGRCQPERGSVRWAAQFGGQDDRGTGVADLAVDADGAVYVTGRFPRVAYFDGKKYEPPTDRSDAYIAKYDATGDFQWVHVFGGDDEYFRDRGTGLVVDSSGTLWTTGYIMREITVDGQTFDHGGTPRMYLFEFDASGALQSANFYHNVRPQALELDGDDDLYVTGHHTAANNALDLDDDGIGGDLFVAKLDAAGDLIWSTKPTDAPDRERGWDIAVDASERVAVTGSYEGDVDFDGSPSFAHAADEDLFVLALAADGSPRWGATLATDATERGRAVAVDSSGALYLGGEFGGTATFAGAMIAPNGGYRDALLAKWDAAGTPEWVRTFGGADELDRVNALAIHPTTDDLYAGGRFSVEADFGDGPVPGDDFYHPFLAAYAPSGDYQWANVFGDTGGQRIHALATDDAGLYAAGFTTRPIDLGDTRIDPNPHSWTNFITELVP